MDKSTTGYLLVLLATLQHLYIYFGLYVTFSYFLNQLNIEKQVLHRHKSFSKVCWLSFKNCSSERLERMNVLGNKDRNSNYYSWIGEKQFIKCSV